MTINFYCLRETSLYNSSSRNLTTTTTRRNFQIHPKLSLPVTSPTPPSSRKVKPKTFRSQIKSLCSAIIIMRKRTSQIAENRRHEGGVAVDTARGRGERERVRPNYFSDWHSEASRAVQGKYQRRRRHSYRVRSVCHAPGRARQSV